MQKTIFTILSILDRETASLSSSELARQLQSHGIELSERTVRHYLRLLGEKGYTEGEKKRGRRLTDKGRQELRHGFVSERMGFSINRINNLAFLSDFNLDTLKGRVILNTTYISEDRVADALTILATSLGSPYSMSSRMTMARGGEKLGDLIVPAGLVGIGTVCSITLNGVFLKAGIPVCPKFGGVVDIVDHAPERFVSVISYEASSIAPLEAFMRGRMTNVLGVLRDGTGRILGSLREIPEASLGDAVRLNERMRKNGFHGIIVFGRPGEAVLGIPVTPDKVGMVVLGGLNPVAALQEAGIPAESKAMSTLSEYGDLAEVDAYLDLDLGKKTPDRSILDYLEGTPGRRSTYWSILSEMQHSTL